MSTKLCNENLQAIANAGLATIPEYDRSKLKSGIVHIGPSHFARGHILRYLDDIAKTDPNWGVTMLALRSTDVRDALEEQDYLYSLQMQDGQENPTRIIGCITSMIVAPENPNAALEALASHDTKLVTMTVTELGYNYNPVTGTLDFENEAIQKCLDPSDDPSTAIGYLVAALERRMQSDIPALPLTIMSCDNIEANGVVLQNVVLAYASEKSPELRRYIEDNVTFPSTMVDCIVPTTSPIQKEFSKASAPITENWAVNPEDFRQWVIEDKFAGDMPDLASVGATITNDVNPFKNMKLRMLNGGHVAVGTIGKLMGYEYVHDAMGNHFINNFIQEFMAEVSRTLTPIQNVDFSLYQSSLIKRLENSALGDENFRVSRNSLGKMESRILEATKHAIAHDDSYNHTAFVTAAWIQSLKGTNEYGNNFDINDPHAISSGLQKIAQNSNGNPRPVIAASGVFDTKLQNHKGFVKAVTMHLHNIQKHGVVGAIERMHENAEPMSKPTQKTAHTI